MQAGGRFGAGRDGILAAALAVVAALAVAMGAALLLSPGGGPEPVAVDAADYLPSAAVERAKEFRSGQRNLLLAGLAIELIALVTLAAGRPRWVTRLIGRVGVRPLLGAGCVGVGISLLLALLALPTGLWAHQRAADVGLAVQSIPDWLADRALAAAIAAGLAGIGAVVLIALQRRLPRAWWVAASAVVIAYAIVSSWLAPVVLAPLFNDFERLEPGPARAEASALARRAGVEIGEIQRVDASRRSTALNAYVDGIGSSKRIVLYDNLLDSAEREAMRSILAHELAHVVNHDLRRGLIFVALVAPIGMLATARVGSAIASRRGVRPGTPLAVPVFALPLVVLALLFGLVGNGLSRAIERAADRYALELTGDPRGMIELQRELARRNRSHPGPFGPVDQLLRTHPSTVERIGAALAFERERPESGMNSGDAGR